MFCLFPYLPRRWESHGRQTPAAVSATLSITERYGSLLTRFCFVAQRQRDFSQMRRHPCTKAVPPDFRTRACVPAARPLSAGGRRFPLNATLFGFLRQPRAYRLQPPDNRLPRRHDASATACVPLAFALSPTAGRTERIGHAARVQLQPHQTSAAFALSSTAIERKPVLPTSNRPPPALPTGSLRCAADGNHWFLLHSSLKPTATVRNASRLSPHCQAPTHSNRNV